MADGTRSDDATILKIHHHARLAGFQESLVQAGYALDSSLLGIGNSSLESGKKAAYQLLRLSVPPTAIFCTNDLMALGVISAAWELGIHVPHQLSVVGVDDISLAAYNVPPLTTVAISKRAVVQQALDILFAMIEGKHIPSPPVLQPKLVVRGSTAPLNVKHVYSIV